MNFSKTLQISLDKAATDLRTDGFAIFDDFLSSIEVHVILDMIDKKKDEGEFRKAGIGKESDFQIKKQVRGDLIRWIDEEEKIPTNEIYLPRIKSLVLSLNRFCFLGLVDYEFHQTYYPIGSFYARHTDTFKKDPTRVISSVCYLNPAWKSTDGGELVIYQDQPDGSETPIKVEPIGGRLVIFESRLWHEVLPCNAERYSVTGWFKNQRRFI
jgi:SM-20-related protein